MPRKPKNHDEKRIEIKKKKELNEYNGKRCNTYRK